jgi:hypothetical protein
VGKDTFVFFTTYVSTMFLSLFRLHKRLFVIHLPVSSPSTRGPPLHFQSLNSMGHFNVNSHPPHCDPVSHLTTTSPGIFMMLQCEDTVL